MGSHDINDTIEIAVAYNLGDRRWYPTSWRWYECVKEYSGVEFDGKGAQLLGYLPLCVGDKMALLPQVLFVGTEVFSECQPACVSNKYRL